MIFVLTINNNSNWEWRAVLHKNEDSRLGVIETINSDLELVISNEPIKMYLINVQSVKHDRKEKPFEADLVYWLDDITLNAATPSIGACLIVSNALKSIIEQFSLPHHRFYPVNLINSEDTSQFQRYYLLHILGSIIDNTNYLKSEYSYRLKGSKEVLKKETGTFDSYESYSKAERLSRKENNIFIEVSKRVLTVEYDIVWGIINHLRINTKVKNAIENSDLKGLRISPFSDYDIILPSEIN